MKLCPKCNITHEKPGTYCSQSCANKRVSAIKGRHFVSRVKKTCPECDLIFTSSVTANKIYCSANCAKKNAGGYRPGSGRAKTGYYKGIYCGSTYELVWVIHCIDNNIAFKRFDSLLEHDGVKYYPDFLIGNDIIEIKGYEKQESVDKKTDVAKFHGYNVVILRKDDLQIQFDWVTTKYNTTKYHTLYDNYKPSYTYSCSHCNALFERDKKLKTDIVYCSRKCAGHGHTGIPNPLGHNQYTSNKGD